MFDLKLNNNCNHRIINELLKIKGSFPNYYAQLMSPAIGNNKKIIIKDQENLFKNDYKEQDFLLGEDNKTILLLNIDKPLEETYPKKNFYITYYTNQSNCPRCKEQNGKINDISLNPIGKLNTINKFESLIQKFKKCLITEINSNYFNENYGSNLVNLIGKPKTALTVLIIQQNIEDTAEFIKQQQSQYIDFLDESELLLKIDNFQINPNNNNPKMINISFDLYNYAYQSKKIEFNL